MFEPYIEKSYYQARLEREHKKYLRGCPWCVVCDTQIEDPKCYVLDKYDRTGSCVCKGCMEKQLDKWRKVTQSYIFEELAEIVEYKWEQVTPHDDFK